MLAAEPGKIKGLDINRTRDVAVYFIKEKGLANAGREQGRRNQYRAAANDNN